MSGGAHSSNINTIITKPMDDQGVTVKSGLAEQLQTQEHTDKSLLDETFSTSTDEDSTSSNDDACGFSEEEEENEYENDVDYEDDAISKTMHEALTIATRTLGGDHCRVNCILLHIAAMHRDRREYKESIEYFEQAMNLAKKRLGEGHPDVARILVHMGSVYRRNEKLEDAIRCFMQALDLFEAAGVPSHNFHVSLTLRICKRVSFQLSDSMRRRHVERSR